MWTGEQRNFTPDTLEYVNGTPKDGSGGRKTYVFRQSRTGNRRARSSWVGISGTKSNDWTSGADHPCRSCKRGPPVNTPSKEIKKIRVSCQIESYKAIRQGFKYFYLAAIDILDGCFAYKEINVISISHRTDKIGSCKRIRWLETQSH